MDRRLERMTVQEQEIKELVDRYMEKIAKQYDKLGDIKVRRNKLLTMYPQLKEQL